MSIEALEALVAAKALDCLALKAELPKDEYDSFIMQAYWAEFNGLCLALRNAAPEKYLYIKTEHKPVNFLDPDWIKEHSDESKILLYGGWSKTRRNKS